MTLLMTAKIRLFFGTGKQLGRKVRIALQLGGWIFIVFDFPSRGKCRIYCFLRKRWSVLLPKGGGRQKLPFSAHPTPRLACLVLFHHGVPSAVSGHGDDDV